MLIIERRKGRMGRKKRKREIPEALLAPFRA
jgi:hypothetical protein